MAGKVRLLVLVLAIPAIGFAVSMVMRGQFNSELRTAVLKQFPQANAALVSKMTVDQLCEDPTPGLRSLCSTNANLNLLSTAALGAWGLGLALLLAIWVGGAVARGNRSVLLGVFRPAFI